MNVPRTEDRRAAWTQALRQREESLLTQQALHDEADAKAGAIAQLEAEGSKVRCASDTRIVQRTAALR